MSAKERVLMIRLLEKAQRHPEYLKRLGVEATLSCTGPDQSKGQGAS